MKLESQAYQLIAVPTCITLCDAQLQEASQGLNQQPVAGVVDVSVCARLATVTLAFDGNDVTHDSPPSDQRQQRHGILDRC